MTYRTKLLQTGLVVALYAAVASQASAGAGYLGREFPTFTARDAITGREFSLNDLRGKVVLVDFWATWCGPCVAELPNVLRAHRKYKDQGFEIVSISLDSNNNRFRSFVRNKGMNWHHVMEGGGWKTRLARKYSINSIPRMYLLDATGICISENVRGRQLDGAIQRVLAKMPAAQDGKHTKRGTDRPSNRLGPAAARRLRIHLDDARATVNQTADSLLESAHQLDALAEEIDNLDAQLPAPEDSARLKKRFMYLHNELHKIRHTMFMSGLIDDQRTVRLPTSPLEAPPMANSRAFVQAKQQLEAARAAIDLMKRVDAQVRDELASIGEEIRSLRGDISRGSLSGKALESRVGQVCDQADSFAQRWQNSWQSRLREADGIITAMAQPIKTLSYRLEGLLRRIAAVRDQFSQSPSDAPALKELRDAFGAICKDVRETYDQLQSLGIIVGDAPPLPTNPFDGRRLTDHRILAQLDEQIQAADDAVEPALETVAQYKRRLGALTDEAVAMQGELAECLGSGGDADDLRPQFSELCRRILALQDQLARPSS
ncbi:MAG: thioredoxin-like domain-containing protein [Planctomycetota bacterium]|nr:thioredoxin-like domain-containing protein [Planctomycetota bacterium]